MVSSVRSLAVLTWKSLYAICPIRWDSLTEIGSEVLEDILGVTTSSEFDDMFEEAVRILQGDENDENNDGKGGKGGDDDDDAGSDVVSPGDVLYQMAETLGVAALDLVGIPENLWPSLTCALYFSLREGLSTTTTYAESQDLVEAVIVEWTDGIIFGLNKGLDVQIVVETDIFKEQDTNFCSELTPDD